MTLEILTLEFQRFNLIIAKHKLDLLASGFCIVKSLKKYVEELYVIGRLGGPYSEKL